MNNIIFFRECLSPPISIWAIPRKNIIHQVSSKNPNSSEAGTDSVQMRSVKTFVCENKKTDIMSPDSMGGATLL